MSSKRNGTTTGVMATSALLLLTLLSSTTTTTTTQARTVVNKPDVVTTSTSWYCATRTEYNTTTQDNINAKMAGGKFKECQSNPSFGWNCVDTNYEERRALCVHVESSANLGSSQYFIHTNGVDGPCPSKSFETRQAAEECAESDQLPADNTTGSEIDPPINVIDEPSTSIIDVTEPNPSILPIIPSQSTTGPITNQFNVVFDNITAKQANLFVGVKDAVGPISKLRQVIGGLGETVLGSSTGSTTTVSTNSHTVASYESETNLSAKSSSSPSYTSGANSAAILLPQDPAANGDQIGYLAVGSFTQTDDDGDTEATEPSVHFISPK